MKVLEGAPHSEVLLNALIQFVRGVKEANIENQSDISPDSKNMYIEKQSIDISTEKPIEMAEETRDVYDSILGILGGI